MTNNLVLKNKRARQRLFTRQEIGLLYISPWILGFLVFTVYPMVASLVYCFEDFNFLSEAKFVGLKNFYDVFTHNDFLRSAKATGTYVLFAVPAKLLSALLLALLLNAKLRAVNFYRIVLVCSSSIILTA